MRFMQTESVLQTKNRSEPANEGYGGHTLGIRGPQGRFVLCTNCIKTLVK